MLGRGTLTGVGNVKCVKLNKAKGKVLHPSSTQQFLSWAKHLGKEKKIKKTKRSLEKQ